MPLVRVLFVAHGPAHVPWTVPLAWAAQLAGHDVRVAARPQSVAQVLAAGLIAVPIGTAAAGDAFIRRATPDSGERPARIPPDWPSGPLGWSEERRLRWSDQVLGLADSLADDLVAFARHWRPDLVVHDVGAVVGLIAAAAVGVPAAAHNWCQPIGLYFLHEDEVPPAYVRLFERFGAQPRIGTDIWIDCTPPALRTEHPVPRIPMRYVPYNGPGELPDWLRREPARRRICVTGGITTSTIDDLGRRLLEEAEQTDAEFVLAVNRPEAFDGAKLPGNVTLTGRVPLTALLATCHALVQHGGAGSTMTALAHGVPQIVVPDGTDTPSSLYGVQIEQAGAGIHLRPEDRHPGALTTALARLLDHDTYARRARAVRDEIAAMPSPAEVMAQLEAHARNPRPTAPAHP
ncbi:nucleotide disphospho-sugar-binding domain-containing protein [Streptomyces sp. NRRL F-5727]|uniref:nucleotide disphospho-sugar-binding domain-containing protein n=1 Tax=Streptomyces sp. NRRL F-5727 TaxID=1463871 RepID=UPI00099DC586|nr:nucleotide disphospho-sugar-binding domain-containing protein [Streptomyces sp. NRRL F-5727]